ncbi:hypothetical protein MNEG_15432 [Monoraphidium neglectum]|uniref:Uncharacterized protein n=1 Tax=Monoraphidium neglectum TaxID=145388 RepID=A0A0D2IX39_9CHLO|nr:hypothetical protein MNEG_15432 [Monoraphidium neglectum]KIY92532.1 hypothetical protein MNEG_15432 [Monoraphidium neglectum]|eukprot:XP_013891552.1 hypothetical protein MNEG_15432 [Monoraphidium neglectum]
MLPPAPAKLSDWELADLPFLAAYLRDRLRRHDDEAPLGAPGAAELLLDQLEEGLRALHAQQAGAGAGAPGGGPGWLAPAPPPQQLRPLAAEELPPGFEVHVRAFVAPGELVEACATEGQGETEGRSISSLAALDAAGGAGGVGGGAGAAGMGGGGYGGARRASGAGDDAVGAAGGGAARQMQQQAREQQQREQQQRKEKQKKASNLRNKLFSKK